MDGWVDRRMDSWPPRQHDVALRRQRRGLAGLSCIVSTQMPPMMHSAMQAPPQYVLKTSLLKRITPTAALLIWKHGQVWFAVIKHQYLSSSFVHRPPAGVLSWQRDGQLPQPNNIKHPRTNCSLANHGPVPSTTTTPDETTTASPDG